MPRRRTAIAMLAVVMGVLCGPAQSVAVTEPASVTSGVPVPAIPRGQGETCVAETGFMRRNHMTLLRHQRDDTMRRGIRGNPYSLEECISCHAVTGPDAMPLTVDSPQHFCRACHDYAAVSIDCFQCHASRPESGIAADSTRSSSGVAAAGVSLQ